jgi:predicted ABC-type ATPase
MIHKKPELFVIAGPNGTGKSTLTRKLEKLDNFPKIYINSDEIKKNEQISDIAALRKAMNFELDALQNYKSFAFETVLTHASTIMKLAKENNYIIKLYYIFTHDPAINIKRVQQRVASGGHDIPHDIIIKRYIRSTDYLKKAFQMVDYAEIYNNSFLHPTLIAEKINKQITLFPLSETISNGKWTKQAIEKLLGLAKN